AAGSERVSVACLSSSPHSSTIAPDARTLVSARRRARALSERLFDFLRAPRAPLLCRHVPFLRFSGEEATDSLNAGGVFAVTALGNSARVIRTRTAVTIHLAGAETADKKKHHAARRLPNVPIPNSPLLTAHLVANEER